MSLKTHPNFKSMVSEINDINLVKNMMNRAFIDRHQYWLKRNSTTWEMNHYWYDTELDKVNIDLEKIDRLYYISLQRFDYSATFQLVARMKYENDDFLYLNLNSVVHRINNYKQGTLFVSFFPNLFVKYAQISNKIMNIILNNNVEIEKKKKRKNINRNTHINFKSIVPTIKNANDIENVIIDTFSVCQSKFRVTSTRLELENYWKPKQLQNISIDVEKIDRVYLLEFIESQLLFIFRMVDDYNNKSPFYIKLAGSGSCGIMMISKSLRDFALEISINNDNVRNFILDDVSHIKTHPNFKSFWVPVNTAADIHSIIGTILHCQSKLNRRAVMTDERYWTLNDLASIEINVEHIDRLFYVIYDKDYDYYVLAARINNCNNEKPFYVQVFASIQSGKVTGVITVNRNIIEFIDWINLEPLQWIDKISIRETSQYLNFYYSETYNTKLNMLKQSMQECPNEFL